MDAVAPSSPSALCSEVIDLSHIESQGFCPYCHNFSLEDHGPVTRGAASTDYYLQSYDGRLWMGFTEGELLPSQSSGTVQQPYPNPACQYCRLLSECIACFNPLPQHMTPGQSCLCCIRLFPTRNAWVQVSTPTGGLVAFELWTAPDSSGRKGYYPFEKQGQLTRQPPAYCGDETIQFLQAQMTACLENHRDCKPNPATPLPSRLLFVGTSDDQIRLVETKDDSAHIGAYTALSHCWGKATHITTTRDNLQAFKKRIRADSLTQVFKDAVQLTRLMGIPFLWIDAFGIVQDDINDWAVEAGRMQDVFENASLVIVATRCADSRQTFLGPSARYHRTFLRFTIRGYDGEMCHVNAWRISRNGTHPTETKGPLTTRAWCFQETTLPRRAMHFTEEEAWWHCIECYACESRPASVPWLPPKTRIVQDPPQQWRQLIASDYSGRQLTNPTDRLPAVAGIVSWYKGIAKSVQGPSDYLAGIWARDIEFELSWFRMRTQDHAPDSYVPRQFVAPSWSWASISDEFTWQTRYVTVQGYKAHTHLVRWSCEPVTANLHGNVAENSHIVVRGKVLDMYLEAKGNSAYIARFQEQNAKSQVKLATDCRLVPIANPEKMHRPLVARARSRAEVEAADATWSTYVQCLLLYTSVRSSVAIMLSKRAPNYGAELSYERIGQVSDIGGWAQAFEAAEEQEIVIY